MANSLAGRILPRRILPWSLGIFLLQIFWIVFWTYLLCSDVRALYPSERISWTRFRFAIGFLLGLIASLLAIAALGQTMAPSHLFVLALAFVFAVGSLVMLTMTLIAVHERIVIALKMAPGAGDKLKIVLLSAAFFLSLPYIQKKVNELAAKQLGAMA